MNIKFNIEPNPEVAFYALYAGLRMFQDKKMKEDKLTPGQFNQAGAEAYCLLEDLKKQSPEEYKLAKEEYELVNSNPDE